MEEQRNLIPYNEDAEDDDDDGDHEDDDGDDDDDEKWYMLAANPANSGPDAGSMQIAEIENPYAHDAINDCCERQLYRKEKKTR